MTDLPVPAPEAPAPVQESNVVNAAKGALRSFVIVFVTMVIPAVFQFLNGIMGWANEGGHAPFPEVSALGYAAVAAVMGAIAASLTFVLRFAENSLGVGLLRSSLPVKDDDPNDNGSGEFDLLIKVLVLVVLVVFVIWLVLALTGGK